jgi:hypothetical protein
MQENILFKGKVTVTKGDFTVDFLLPKEVSLQKNLKMQLTAYNELSDAMGMFDNIIAMDAGGAYGAVGQVAVTRFRILGMPRRRS